MTIDDTTLMKYMQGLCSEKEIDEISRWLEQSEENRKAFRDAHFIYESILMSTDPEKLRMPARSRTQKTRRWRYLVATVSAAAAISAAVLITGHYSRKNISERLLTIEVPAGKMMTLTLSDGTSIDLNSGAKLVYPPVFYGKERKVGLDGEAMFHVNHDPEHPFTVETFAANVKVLGTEFNVHKEKECNIFSTSLVSGIVQVSSTSNVEDSYILSPDQTVKLVNGSFVVEDRLDSQTLYWTEGLINISGITFDALMERLENAFDVHIVIDRHDIPEINCTSGEIRISDGIDNALRVLQHVAEFDYEKDLSSGTIHIR